MQESTKTICFVVAAAVLGVAAIGNAWLSQPGAASENELVGKEFFPDFVSTEAARSLEVSAIDPETGSLKRFGVKSDGDLWRIPTHFDYPAEAAARIAQTSASVMGLKAEAIVGMGESEFEKFGVVDPLSDDLEDPETAGKRITLLDENGDPLVDYIIGKEIEDDVPTRSGGGEFEAQNATTDFYIRKAEDSQTFRVALDIDLSTRFSDWIDPDLLRINRPDVTLVSINNYKLEERGAGAFGMTQLFKDQGDEFSFRRPSPTEDWFLDGMDSATEELQTDRINEILGVLDEMVIVGVRPKFKYEGQQLLTAELVPAEIEAFKKDPEKAADAYRSMQKDLMDKGFNFGGSQQQLELLSENGELEFGTSKGLRYRLHVGGEFTDGDDMIEIGSEAETESKEEAKSETEEKSDENANRFVFVRVTFDETLLGDRPAEPKLPEAPVKPEGYEPVKPVEIKGMPPEEVKSEAAEGKTEDAESEGDDKKEEKEEKDPVEEREERDPKFAEYEDAMTAFEVASGDHEMNLTRYKQDVEAFEKKIEEGKKLVDELNQRFGDWYYVISASNLGTIQSLRADLVKPATNPQAGGAGMPGKPNISLPNMQGGNTFGSPEMKAQMEKIKAQMEAEKASREAEAKPEEKPAMENKEPAAEPKTEEAVEPKKESVPDPEPAKKAESVSDPDAAPKKESVPEKEPTPEPEPKKESVPEPAAEKDATPKPESAPDKESVPQKESGSDADNGDEG